LIEPGLVPGEMATRYRCSPSSLHLLELMIEGATYFELFIAAPYVHDLMAAEVAGLPADSVRRSRRKNLQFAGESNWEATPS
jgi:hypothetical protein